MFSRPRRPALRTLQLIEPLEARRLLAFALNVNFQPSGTSVPAGYVADVGYAYGSRGNGYTYGWNQANTTATRDRNSAAAPDQRYDTLTHTQPGGASRTWELAVPNGQYQVRIVAGDPSYFDSVYKINVEGTLAVNGTPTSSNRFIEGIRTVTISDGRITLTNASGAANNKLAFVEVQSVETTTKPTVSVSASDASASEPGTNTGRFTLTRTGSTSAAMTVLYSVGGSATNGTDYDMLDGDVVIPAGASSVTVTITPKNDSAAEGSESVVMTLSSSIAYSIGAGSATVNIADDEPPIPSGAWPTSWSSAAQGNRNRWESGAAVIDGKIWVFGGWFSGSDLATQSYDVYDPAANKWTFKGTAPIPHSHFGMAADDANNVIYFAGGLFGGYPGVPSNKVWKFNVNTNTWSSLPSMPENHSSGGMALVNNELHVIGGVLDDRETNTGAHLVLNLNNLAAGWSSAPALPSPRDHFGTVVLGGKIYVVGGEFGHDLVHDQQALVHRYDPVARSWQQVASMPTPKSHFEAAIFVNPQGRLVVAGGQVDDWASTDEVIEYDPSTNTWKKIGVLPMKLQGAVVQQVGNKIYVHSGNPGPGPIKSTWIGTLS